MFLCPWVLNLENTCFNKVLVYFIYLGTNSKVCKADMLQESLGSLISISCYYSTKVLLYSLKSCLTSN